ncbi:MAG: FKBP-type peptidyl-prolyl cis-trans isomerase [Bacteroidota bacterium]|nr:FKBP-type peptidyl-prolyl cis-trans isomerase [Bacteroidota bacterium]
MKKVLFKSLLLLMVTSVILTSCSKHRGFKKLEKGLYYKIYESKNKPTTIKKAKIGDILTLDIVYRIIKNKKDSVLFSSYKMGNPMVIELMKPEYKGDIIRGFAELCEGDSATFIANADSFFLKSAQMKQLPDFIKKGSEIYFDVKLRKVQSKTEYQTAKEAEMKKLEGEENKKLDEYISKNNIKEKPTKSGLIYIELKKGNGAKAKMNDKVKINYTGYLIDGKKFDSSYDRNQPFDFTAGIGNVVPGMDEAINMMQVGGKAKIIIPSKIAYGARGAGPIPPFSTLIFEIELLEISNAK